MAKKPTQSRTAEEVLAELVAACKAMLSGRSVHVKEDRDQDGYPEGLAEILVTLDELDALRAALAKAKLVRK